MGVWVERFGALKLVWFLQAGAIVGLLSVNSLASAQVTPDGTVGTVVNLNNSTANISGGTQLGNNLFHSFREFSLTPGATNAAVFNNADGIENIITRVTGGSISNINGLIEAKGSANLFFLNPNGIIFGEQAALNIGGSFFASTANSLRFADGTEFSAIAGASPPLLTMSVPIGLQYGAAPGAIQVQGSGNNLFVNPSPFEIVRIARPAGLSVDPGKTLALLGGPVEVLGGNLTAEQGQIEIAAVANSTVSFTPTSSGWNFSYPSGASFGSVTFAQAASADASGFGGGRIRVQAQDVNVRDGSSLLALTLADGAGGDVTLNATGMVTVQGEADWFPSSLLAEVSLGASGKGGNITVNARRFLVADGAKISTSTSGSGEIGQLAIAANEVEIRGASPNFGGSLISADVVDSAGNGGLIWVRANRLQVADGGSISASTSGSGNGSSVTIQANTIELVSGSPWSGSSGIFVSTFPGTTIRSQQGNAGSLTIEANRLFLADGAQIGTSTLGLGNAGDLTIRAQDIELRGADAPSPTGIFASVSFEGAGQGANLLIAAQRLRVLDGAQIAADTLGSGNAGTLTIRAQEVELAGFREQGSSGLFAGAIAGTGAGGDIDLRSDRLIIRDGATINASNFASRNSQIPPGQGAAGDIRIQANSIRLDQGKITASTAVGGKGNISLRSQQLTLANNSLITTNSQGLEPGGNIQIDSRFIVGRGNSDITANAVNARGGQVVVTTEGMFGISSRDRLTSDNDITATSDLGVEFNGTVQINTPDVDPARGLDQLPDGLVRNQQIAASCEPGKGAALAITGRGGLPTNASQPLQGETVWEDLRTPTQSQSINTQDTVSTSTHALVEAQGWFQNANGKIELVANLPVTNSQIDLSRNVQCYSQR